MDSAGKSQKMTKRLYQIEIARAAGTLASGSSQRMLSCSYRTRDEAEYAKAALEQLDKAETLARLVCEVASSLQTGSAVR